MIDPDDRYLEREVDRVLINGALVAGWLGTGSGLAVLVLIVTGKVGMEIPAVFAFLGGGYGFALHALARRGVLRSSAVRTAVMVLSLMPTGFFVASEAWGDGGAAAVITGPYSYLYYVLIVLAAFTLQRWYAVIAGAVSALGYLVVYAIARDDLRTITAPEAILVRDLHDDSVFALRAMMMVACGLLAEGLARYSKRLIRRVLSERDRRDLTERLFGQYVSEEVRERITSEKGAAAGERCAVAVLFSDLRGFSRFSEQHAPEEVLARLNAYFDRMVPAIHAESGVVDKFIGDAVMGVFGGLVPLDQPCARAFEAALAMRRALDELNARWAAEGKEPFESGIGLDHGEVVQGALGAERRKEFTVIGDPVNTASRVEGLSKELGYPIVMTAAVYERLAPEQQARCTRIGDREVKGKARTVAVYGAK